MKDLPSFPPYPLGLWRPGFQNRPRSARSRTGPAAESSGRGRVFLRCASRYHRPRRGACLAEALHYPQGPTAAGRPAEGTTAERKRPMKGILKLAFLLLVNDKGKFAALLV